MKFLTTLQRQFANLMQGDLKKIEETLVSLLNGLKLIWTISKHISTHDEKMQHILQSISHEICQKVRDKIDLKTIFRRKTMALAIADIDQGISVLDKWDK